MRVTSLPPATSLSDDLEPDDLRGRVFLEPPTSAERSDDLQPVAPEGLAVRFPQARKPRSQVRDLHPQRTGIAPEPHRERTSTARLNRVRHQLTRGQDGVRSKVVEYPFVTDELADQASCMARRILTGQANTNSRRIVERHSELNYYPESSLGKRVDHGAVGRKPRLPSVFDAHAVAMGHDHCGGPIFDAQFVEHVRDVVANRLR